MVEVGVAVTVDPVVALSPVAGPQLYVIAPDATRIADDPGQMLDGLAAATVEGRAFTVM